LQYNGPEKFATYDEPLAGLSHEEVVQLVFKWIGYNSKHGQSFDIRMRIEEFATTYGLKLVKRNRAVYITRLWEVSNADEKHYTAGFRTLVIKISQWMR